MKITAQKLNNINLKDFITKMDAYYTEFYNRGGTDEEWEYCQAFDREASKHGVMSLFLKLVVQARQDFISSDREAAAFMKALAYYL